MLDNEKGRISLLQGEQAMPRFGEALACMKIHDHESLVAMAAAARQDQAEKIAAGEYLSFSGSC
jgi:hypothetical protein